MNPCLGCGACCVSFRVDFHPAELSGGTFQWDTGVPPSMVVRVTDRFVRMCGTDVQPPRCVALVGNPGSEVACSIYASRPSPCREFGPEHEACARARRRIGLPAL